MATTAKQDGNRLFKAGRYADAQRRYSEGIDCLDRGNGIGDSTGKEDQASSLLLAQLYTNRSATHLKLQQLPQATSDAMRAATLAPQWGKPHVRLAESLYAQCKYAQAVAELEIALGIASASQDHALVGEIQARLAEYRLLKDAEDRGESQNLAYNASFQYEEGPLRDAAQSMAGMRGDQDQDPSDVLDKLLKMDLNNDGGDGGGGGGESIDTVMDRHVLLGHQALRDGRYHDAVREFLAAALKGNAEGMYNYAVLLENGRGVPRDIPQAVQWLEKAAAVPVESDGALPGVKNRGIGEALSALARHYSLGIYYRKEDAKAVELWRKATALGSSAALNALGVHYSMRPTKETPVDLPRARDLLRQSAEMFSNEAMLNLAELHASLQEFATAARWAESAHKFGFVPAAKVAKRYRELAKISPQLQSLDPGIKQGLDEMAAIARLPGPSMQRDNETPTLEELRLIKTPYGQRLRQAKEWMEDAVAYCEDDQIEMAVAFAVQAHQVDDACLVFAPHETMLSIQLASVMQAMGVPLDAGLAMLLQPPDRAATIAFWKALHLQFPDDHRLAVQAACAMMFEGLAGSDKHAAVALLDATFALLPHPSDDSDPDTMKLLYLAGSSHWQLQHMALAKKLLSRFLVHAVKDGHRKVPEAHFLLGLIAVMQSKDAASRDRKTKLMRTAAEHLRQGIAMTKKLPPFLQRKAESPNQRMLANTLRIVATAMHVSLDLPTTTASATAEEKKTPPHQPSPRTNRPVRGGELVAGPRRHEKLRSDTSSLTRQWKTARVAMMKMLQKMAGHTTIAMTLPPPRRSTASSSSSTSASLRGRLLEPATIDELFSALQDKVYQGRSLECIVVAPPVCTGSSYAVIVEDSQREPARMAVYNASPVVIQQLVPGQVLSIRDPYVRLAQDQSIMLRVDDPKHKLEMRGAPHAICWNCSAVSASGSDSGGSVQLRSCAKCHRAMYCSRACQKQDWHECGHRYQCA